MPEDLGCLLVLTKTELGNGGITHQGDRSITSVKSVNTEDQKLLLMQMPVIQSATTVDKNTITEKCTQGHVWGSAFTVECLAVIQKKNCVSAKR